MPTLRHARHLVRFVPAWFVLSLGVAIASPVIQPQSMQFVCSAAGTIQVIVQTDGGARELGAGHLDCPMCMLTGAPPPAAQPVDLPKVLPLGHAVQPIPAARIAAATSAPLPARGPPSLS